MQKEMAEVPQIFISKKINHSAFQKVRDYNSLTKEVLKIENPRQESRCRHVTDTPIILSCTTSLHHC